jgi:hypothetical protein
MRLFVHATVLAMLASIPAMAQDTTASTQATAEATRYPAVRSKTRIKKTYDRFKDVTSYVVQVWYVHSPSMRELVVAKSKPNVDMYFGLEHKGRIQTEPFSAVMGFFVFQDIAQNRRAIRTVTGADVSTTAYFILADSSRMEIAAKLADTDLSLGLGGVGSSKVAYALVFTPEEYLRLAASGVFEVSLNGVEYKVTHKQNAEGLRDLAALLNPALIQQAR